MGPYNVQFDLDVYHLSFEILKYHARETDINGTLEPFVILLWIFYNMAM